MKRRELVVDGRRLFLTSDEITVLRIALEDTGRNADDVLARFGDRISKKLPITAHGIRARSAALIHFLLVGEIHQPPRLAERRARLADEAEHSVWDEPDEPTPAERKTA